MRQAKSVDSFRVEHDEPRACTSNKPGNARLIIAINAKAFAHCSYRDSAFLASPPQMAGDTMAVAALGEHGRLFLA